MEELIITQKSTHYLYIYIIYVLGFENGIIKILLIII
jgi:hypothetical protein